eukprot:TRINITY_DN758_c0_g1_i4.p1 TRINITY_DN758_c0_g1~~TRINITY_DN758_c0_g1_i4.p1  ORF type:complete len:154 (-),score=44.82 TRINITY_DN758_c0_g1_i4:499-960(-)
MCIRDRSTQSTGETSRRDMATNQEEELVQEVETYSPPSSPKSQAARDRLEERNKEPKWKASQDDVDHKQRQAEANRSSHEASRRAKLGEHEQHAEQVRSRKPERQAEKEKREAEVLQELVKRTSKEPNGAANFKIAAMCVILAGAAYAVTTAM